jgi:hypothetical protein
VATGQVKTGVNSDERDFRGVHHAAKDALFPEGSSSQKIRVRRRQAPAMALRDAVLRAVEAHRGVLLRTTSLPIYPGSSA